MHAQAFISIKTLDDKPLKIHVGFHLVKSLGYRIIYDLLYDGGRATRFNFLFSKFETIVMAIFVHSGSVQ
jgi:hypothetical protein